MRPPHELAQSLGVARRSVTRIITEWREQGIIEQRGHALVVVDLAKLTALSTPDVVGLDWSAARMREND
jgi:DNA-binding transcriptional regulator LsrR (DeoR family)